MVRRVISTIMVFLLSVIKGGAWLGLHLLLVVLEILATLDEAEYIDYSDYQAMEKLRASNKSSFDCIIDAVGDRKTTENCLELLKENGKLCLYGLKDGKLYEYFRQRRFGEHFYVYDESYSVKHAYKEVFGMIQEKQLYSEQWFDKIYELSDIQKALEDLENRKAMKVLFRFPSE